MDQISIPVLAATAASLGFVHTLAGPDHYIPFVAMSRVGRWSLPRTIAITLACGLGHVLSSVVLGVVGIGAGLAVGGLEWFEGLRGGLAGWLLLGFGLAYLVWGLRRAVRSMPHSPRHVHQGGIARQHLHGHKPGHAHLHVEEQRAGSMTPWILFTIFVFGPCEPLIPLLMYPAAKLSLWGVGWVALVFAVATLGTMTVMVTAAHLGLDRFRLSGLERYGHAMAGLAIAACGGAIQLGF